MDELAANPLGLHLAAIRNANATSPNRTRTLLERAALIKNTVRRTLGACSESSEEYMDTHQARALAPTVCLQTNGGDRALGDIQAMVSSEAKILLPKRISQL